MVFLPILSFFARALDKEKKDTGGGSSYHYIPLFLFSLSSNSLLGVDERERKGKEKKNSRAVRKKTTI